jgi:hypothetical protein
MIALKIVSLEREEAEERYLFSPQTPAFVGVLNQQNPRQCPIEISYFRFK